mmetsp:Transcript_6726/g.16848  ORF Transcript_6726/g.16848 Transcript_6726/m.16848 type:complete len:430 (-) Transcript_6726:1820-3109(-)
MDILTTATAKKKKVEWLDYRRKTDGKNRRKYKKEINTILEEDSSIMHTPSTIAAAHIAVVDEGIAHVSAVPLVAHADRTIIETMVGATASVVAVAHIARVDIKLTRNAALAFKAHALACAPRVVHALSSTCALICAISTWAYRLAVVTPEAVVTQTVGCVVGSSVRAAALSISVANKAVINCIVAYTGCNNGILSAHTTCTTSYVVEITEAFRSVESSIIITTASAITTTHSALVDDEPTVCHCIAPTYTCVRKPTAVAYEARVDSEVARQARQSRELASSTTVPQRSANTITRTISTIVVTVIIAAASVVSIAYPAVVTRVLYISTRAVDKPARVCSRLCVCARSMPTTSAVATPIHYHATVGDAIAPFAAVRVARTYSTHVTWEEERAATLTSRVTAAEAARIKANATADYTITTGTGVITSTTPAT